MGDGCTDCGRKGGCDHRKQGMFEAIDQTLARLYPTARWQERHELGAGQGKGMTAGPEPEPASAFGALLAERLAARLKTLALHVPGGPEEYCDYVYVLCLGRTPSLLEVREGRTDVRDAFEHDAGEGISELYLRVALSSLVPFAAVQQVSVRGTVTDGLVLVEEAPRTGVFDPVLLPRFKTLVAVLTELGLRHLDFGEITTAPDGYDPGDYGTRYGGTPTVANYFFFPQPASSITTTAVVLSYRGGIE
jgi:hypothetical protein